MMQGDIRTEQGCLERAASTEKTAELLWNQGDEWFVVCYFYSAYHMARAAIMTDPIFDDLARLQSKARWLVPDDRFVAVHKGRVSSGTPRQAGVNDVVRLLYPDVAGEYVRLHMASIEVRYGKGLRAVHRDSAVQDFRAVQSAYVERRLVAA